MQFSLNTLFFAALALPGVLAAPSANTISQVSVCLDHGANLSACLVQYSSAQDGGITLKLVDGKVVQRVAADGTILGESPLPDGGVEQFKALADETQSRRRDDNVLIQRQCLYGHPCSEDSICYFNGCSGCLFVSTGVGGCV